MTYRVYLRDGQQQVHRKTVTGDPNAARAAFATLVDDAALDGQQLLAVLTKDGSAIAHHNFARPDPINAWRGRIGDLNL